jgi:hypothetical protein
MVDEWAGDADDNGRRLIQLIDEVAKLIAFE